jgi:hypothetical protein
MSAESRDFPPPRSPDLRPLLRRRCYRNGRDRLPCTGEKQNMNFASERIRLALSRQPSIYAVTAISQNTFANFPTRGRINYRASVVHDRFRCAPADPLMFDCVQLCLFSESTLCCLDRRRLVALLAAGWGRPVVQIVLVARRAGMSCIVRQFPSHQSPSPVGTRPLHVMFVNKG